MLICVLLRICFALEIMCPGYPTENYFGESFYSSCWANISDNITLIFAQLGLLRSTGEVEKLNVDSTTTPSSQ